MPPFKQGDVVKVPFPYADRSTRKHRPALVASTLVIGQNINLLLGGDDHGCRKQSLSENHT
jgi:mRNA interferase MazF